MLYKALSKPIREDLLFIACAALSLVILSVDLVIPLGVAAGVPYVLVILVSFGFSRSSSVLLFGLICSLFTVIGFFYSPTGGILWMVLGNRFLALLAIWVVAILGILHKRNYQQLVESDARFQLMIDTSSLMIFLLNNSFQFSLLSRYLETFLDGDMVGEELLGLQGRIHPDDQPEFMSRLELSFEQRLDVQLECRMLNEEGTYRHVLINAAPRYTDANGFIGYIGTFSDISDKRVAERELAEMCRISYHNEKMAAIGTMSAGIIHEVGNPVSAIYGMAQAILDADMEEGNESQLDLRTKEDVVAILEQIERLIGITSDVASFVIMSDDDVEVFDVNDVVKGCCRLMSYDAKMNGIDVSCEKLENSPLVEAEKDHIMQVLINVLSNAAYSCISRVEPKITVETVVDGNEIVINVNDNGCGMTQEVASRAIESFFSTKPVGHGTGLGLPLCKKLLDQYGGQLQIESEPDKGTQIRILLPLWQSDSL
ncbi:MAG: ATP-binding protein [Porticoccus sp.]